MPPASGDDLQAKRLAKDLGLVVVGRPASSFAVKQRGFISAVRPPLDALRAAGAEEIVKAAGESRTEA